MILYSNSFSILHLYVDVCALRPVSSGLGAKPIISFSQIQLLLPKRLKMRVIGPMLLGHPLLHQMRFYALTRLRLLVYVAS
jgi:hypothetical protein